MIEDMFFSLPRMILNALALRACHLQRCNLIMRIYRLLWWNDKALQGTICTKYYDNLDPTISRMTKPIIYCTYIDICFHNYLDFWKSWIFEGISYIKIYIIFLDFQENIMLRSNTNQMLDLPEVTNWW